MMLALCVCCSVDAEDQHADMGKVRLQLKWFHQFQFAGYYAAIEKGFYADEGLEVEILERELKKNFVTQVTSGEAEYGVGDSGLISQYAKGEPIIALAAIFQHNPLVFMAKQDSGIISPYEMVGKRVMSDIISANDAPLRAMLAGANIAEKDYTVIPQSNDYDQLIRDEVDVISGYLTDQPFFFKQKGQKINIINPLNYGVDFYGDILFTSRQELQQHHERVEQFLRASLKGWHYALDHPEELIQLIHDKYPSKLSINHLRFEAAETRKLILPDIVQIGRIEPSRMKMVADYYAASGFNRVLTEKELGAFVYQSQRGDLKLTTDEKAWLNAHPVIEVGVDRSFAPYEQIDEHGNYVGMAADYIRLIEKKLGVHFEFIYDRPWAEILAMARRNELDMLACAVNTQERSEFLTFTQPYKFAHAVIIDNGQGGFIGSLANLAGKRVAVERNYFIQELLEKHYPQIQLIVSNDTKAALEQVLEGKADAYVGDVGSANYLIKKEGLSSLRFSGQTEYFSEHSIAIAKKHPLLVSIVTKAMNSIPKNESDEIFNRWLGLKIEQGVKADVLFKYGSAILIMFALFGYWVYRLQREISVRKRVEHQVQVLLKEQKAMLETELVGIVKVKNRAIIWNNPSFEKMLGYAKGELLGASSRRNYVDQQAYDNLGLQAYPILQSGGIYRTQIEHVCKNGKRIWVDLSGSMLDFATEESLWAFVDITETKEAEDKIRASALYSRSLIEASLDPLMTISANGKIMDVNQATEKITGCCRDELIGNDFSNYFTDPEQAKVGYQQVFANGFLTDFPLVIRHIAGHLTEVLYNATVYRDLHGQVQGVFAAARDITEQKKMERMLADNERHFAVLLSLSPVGVFETDSNGNYTYVNQRWSEITGLTIEQAHGDAWKKAVHDDDKEKVNNEWLTSVSKNRPFQLEYRFCHPDGKITWVLGQSHSFLSLSGKLLGYIGSVTDISELKQMEDTLRLARDQAERAADSKSIFLANMSHEVRTPMNAIIGLSQLALNKPLQDEVRDYLEKINTSSVNLLGILNDILDFSKMEAGKLTIESAPFNLNSLLKNLDDIFSVKANEKNLNFNIEVAPEVPRILQGDALRIQQILTNLLANAIKFTESGKVIVRISLQEMTQSLARLRFCVSDTGIGILPTDQAKLFMPFSQIDASITRRFGGTGLGLAISHKLLSLMSGAFDVDSQSGKGTTICFELTFDLDSNLISPDFDRRQIDRRAGVLGQDIHEQGKTLSGSQILVAEDNAINQQVVREFLQLSGIRVDIAGNGIAALRFLQNKTYDAVIMDVHMPEMGGVEATQYIRKQSRFKALPVIALTAGVTQEERANCLASGMNDFVAKPINPAELIGVLCRWIKKPRTVKSEIENSSNPLSQGAARQPILENLTEFDFTNVLTMAGGDEAFVIKLLCSFYNDYAHFNKELETLLNKNDFKSAKHLVHTLKGVSGNLGAKYLNAAATVLDASLKEERLEPEAYTSFIKELDKTRTALANCLALNPSASLENLKS